MTDSDWIDIGAVEALATKEMQPVLVGRARVALSYKDGVFAAISGDCNHVGGPLGEGQIDGEYVVCPWHYYKFHRRTGLGEPGYEGDAVPAYAVEVKDGRVRIRARAESKRTRLPHSTHALARPPQRTPGPTRVLGISTTVMTAEHPRYSTSEALLDTALEHARTALNCETQSIRARELAFRACEGFYSKSARACTWPCSITEMDPSDQMERVYEGLVHWCDVVLVATPIRWGAASSLYQKLVERLNCVQNQETLANRRLIRDKVAGFIITGGQDNVQAVAGQMLSFFSEIGFQFPAFPFIAHSRGWSAEDMENNMRYVQRSESLHKGAATLAERCVELLTKLIADPLNANTARGGRKAHGLEVHDD